METIQKNHHKTSTYDNSMKIAKYFSTISKGRKLSHDEMIDDKRNREDALIWRKRHRKHSITVIKRRKKNKVARKSRRLNRV